MALYGGIHPEILDLGQNPFLMQPGSGNKLTEHGCLGFVRMSRPVWHYLADIFFCETLVFFFLCSPFILSMSSPLSPVLYFTLLLFLSLTILPSSYPVLFPSSISLSPFLPPSLSPILLSLSISPSISQNCHFESQCVSYSLEQCDCLGESKKGKCHVLPAASSQVTTIPLLLPHPRLLPCCA